MYQHDRKVTISQTNLQISRPSPSAARSPLPEYNSIFDGYYSGKLNTKIYEGGEMLVAVEQALYSCGVFKTSVLKFLHYALGIKKICHR